MKMHRLQPAIDVTPDEEDVALIAAAPILLKAARMALLTLPHGEWCGLQEFHNGKCAHAVLREAIQQAEGKQEVKP